MANLAIVLEHYHKYVSVDPTLKGFVGLE